MDRRKDLVYIIVEAPRIGMLVRVSIDYGDQRIIETPAVGLEHPTPRNFGFEADIHVRTGMPTTLKLL